MSDEIRKTTLWMNRGRIDIDCFASLQPFICRVIRDIWMDSMAIYHKGILQATLPPG